MMMERLLLILITFCILLQVQDTRGQATQVRKKRNNVTILPRLSNLESMSISIQNELVGIKSMLDEFQKASTEIMGITSRLDAFEKVTTAITSRLDELSGMTVHRQAYDKEVIKITLDSIQKGLANEKENRIKLDTIAQETKKIVAEQNTLFERKTELFEERDKQHRLELDTISLEMKEMIAKTRVLENNITQLEQTCTKTCLVTTVAPAESTTSPAILSTRPLTTSPTTQKAKDCWELKAVYGISEDGVYEVVSPNGRKINVRCDMTTDGGGWTVFQRRVDGSVRFDKTYEEYKFVFGSLTGEFWMGNDFLNVFTRDVKQTLRVDICNWDNEAKWAKYKHFSVGPTVDNYRLSVEDYSGTAGDALITGYKGYSRGIHNGQAFSAPGGDHDNWGDGDCASYYQSGWWFNHCYSANLNGPYLPETSSDDTYQGILWRTWIDRHSFKGSEMKIRPSTSSTSSSTNKPFNCPVI